MPTFLATEEGMTAARANTLVGISRVLPVAAVLGAGYLADRLGRRRLIFILLGAEGITVFSLALLHGAPLAAAVLLQPVFVAMYFPLGLAVLSSIGRDSSRNIVLSSVFVLTAVTGTGVIPSFLGYMGEFYSFAAGFALLGALMLLCAPFAFKLPKGQQSS
jgi:NNP family nitrate/nitrite transporter-like MFS transporter